AAEPVRAQVRPRVHQPGHQNSRNHEIYDFYELYEMVVGMTTTDTTPPGGFAVATSWPTSTRPFNAPTSAANGSRRLDAQGHVDAQERVSSRRSDLPIGEDVLDADLARTVRRTSWMRQGFYIVVLLVAMAGQVTGAVEALHIPLIAAVPAVAALELGGIVVLANADVRRRLGERATFSRILSAAIAAWAVTFNWLAHTNHLLGGFYAGMSA